MTLLWFELLFESDGCLAGGTAGGVGDADTITELDAEGFPILRGRTVKGLMTETCSLILRALGSDPWNGVAARLFGEPQRFDGGGGCCDWQDGGVPLQVRKAMTGWKPGMIQAAMTSLRRQTRIDPATGAAETSSLRATRLIRAGTVLRSPIRARLPLTASDLALLATSTAAIRRVGVHRNEGWGRVRAILRDEQGVDRTSEWAGGLDRPVASPPPAQAPAAPAPKTSGDTVVLDLEVLSPVLVAEKLGTSWGVESLPHVPGTALLGAAAARWGGGGSRADAATDAEFRRLFLDGSCRWLPAYPVLDGERSVPLPLTLKVRKGEDGADAIDRAHPKALSKETDGAWTSPRHAFFVRPESGAWSVASLTKTARMHHQRDRDRGRPEEGNIFLYEAIAAGQKLRALVRCARSDDARTLLALLDGQVIRIGRSRTASYGSVRVAARVESGGAETPRPDDLDTDEGVVVTLTSDYLGQDDAGANDPARLVPDLMAALGLPADASVERHLASRTVHGQVGVWAMPRPTAVAIKAGSVVVFRGCPAPASEKVARLEREGVGARRAEGFGGALVGLHGDEVDVRLALTLVGSAGSMDELSLLSDDDLARAAKVRAVLHALRRALTDHAVSEGVVLNPIPPAQVSRLRQRVRTSRHLDDVTSWFKEILGKPAERHYKRVRVGRLTLEKFVKDEMPKILEWGELSPPASFDAAAFSDDDLWTLQQHFLDVLLDTWRRRCQKEGR